IRASDLKLYVYGDALVGSDFDSGALVLLKAARLYGEPIRPGRKKRNRVVPIRACNGFGTGVAVGLGDRYFGVRHPQSGRIGNMTHQGAAKLLGAYWRGQGEPYAQRKSHLSPPGIC